MAYSTTQLARSAGRFFGVSTRPQSEDLQDLPDYVLDDIGLIKRDLPANLRAPLDAQTRTQDQLSAAKSAWF